MTEHKNRANRLQGLFDLAKKHHDELADRHNELKKKAKRIQVERNELKASKRLLQRRLDENKKTQEEYSRELNELAKLPKQERADIILAKQKRIDQLLKENQAFSREKDAQLAKLEDRWMVFLSASKTCTTAQDL